MTDLLDIAPATAYDVVRTSDGRSVKVRGLRSNDIAAIATRFPKLIATVVAAGDNVIFLISALGVATGPVIAAGCDQLGNEQQEAAADRFLLEDQIKLVKAIFRLTFPNGLSSFTEVVANLTEPGKASKNKDPLESIATGIARLIRAGFPPDYAMNLTPRQIDAYLALNEQIDAEERAVDLMVSATAAQGDQKTLDRVFKQLTAQWR